MPPRRQQILRAFIHLRQRDTTWILTQKFPSPPCRALSPFASLGPISVAAISIALVWGAELHERAGILVVGRIQPGLPSPTVSWWFQMESPLRLAGSAGAICLVGLLEAISIAKALAEKYGDRVDAATELRGRDT